MNAVVASVSKAESPSLVRVLTRWDLTALAINGIIGSGIFGLPSIIARQLGYASPVAFIACAGIVYVFVLCFAEVASHFSETGGPYLYGRTIFGPFIGFEVGWSVWLARVSAYATNSSVLVAYLAFFLPAANSGPSRVLALSLISAALTVINIRGVRGGAKLGGIVAAAKIIALVAFALAGVFYVHWSQISSLAAPPGASWGVAILGLIYTFTGFEYAVIPAAEARNPRRDLGWALVIALGICTALYLAIQLVALGTLPMSVLSASTRPLADAGRSFLGPLAASGIAALACISILGNLSALVLVSPRLTLAFAERGDFPQFFGRLHPRYGTPVVSILFFAIIGTLLAVYGSFQWLVIVSVVARLGNYIVTCLALPILRRTSHEGPRFRVTFGPGIAIIGILLCIGLFFQAPNDSKLAFGAASVIGAGLYLARPRNGR